jgi:hypothetical protein
MLWQGKQIVGSTAKELYLLWGKVLHVMTKGRDGSLRRETLMDPKALRW